MNRSFVHENHQRPTVVEGGITPDFRVPCWVSSPETRSVWPGGRSWSSPSCHHSNWLKSPQFPGHGKLKRTWSHRPHCDQSCRCRWWRRWGSTRWRSRSCSPAAPCAAWTASSATARTRMRRRRRMKAVVAEPQGFPQQARPHPSQSSSHSAPAEAPGYFSAAPCVARREGCSRSGCRCGLEQCSSSGHTPDPALIPPDCCRSRWDHPRFYRCPRLLEPKTWENKIEL